MRQIARILICLLLVMTVTASVSAVSAGNIDSYATVSRNGDCQVTMTVALKLDEAVEDITFPVPRNASAVTVNGRRVSTQKTESARLIDLDRFLKGMTGDFSLSISYTVNDVVYTTENKTLELRIPLLAGFDYPVEAMDFSVTLPSPTDQKPGFESGYHKADIEKYLHYTVDGATISGFFTQELKDHETVVMTLPTDSSVFPQTLADIQDYTFGIWGMGICGGLAALYWLIFLAFWPLRFRRSTEPPLDVTAGELACIRWGRGPDLHLSVLSWAQRGYIVIERRSGGRVWLHKRMEMGNERKGSEQQLFRKLFARSNTVDTASKAYGNLCSLSEKKPGLATELIHRRSGSTAIFRFLAAGMGLFGGVCIAIALGSGAVLQGLLILLLGVLGGLSGWYIQRLGSCILSHDRFKLTVALSLCGFWLLLGLIAGAFNVGLWMVLGLMIAGLLLSWAGRRTPLGREAYGQVVGFGWHLLTIRKEQLRQLCAGDNDFFFRLMPYAMALGLDKLLAKKLGDLRIERCPYLAGPGHDQMTAPDWIRRFREILSAMDQRSRRLPFEKLLTILRSLKRR